MTGSIAHGEHVHQWCTAEWNPKLVQGVPGTLCKAATLCLEHLKPADSDWAARQLGAHRDGLVLPPACKPCRCETAAHRCLECLSSADPVPHAVCRVPSRLPPLGSSCWSCTRTPCPGDLPRQFTCSGSCTAWATPICHTQGEPVFGVLTCYHQQAVVAVQHGDLPSCQGRFLDIQYSLALAITQQPLLQIELLRTCATT